MTDPSPVIPRRDFVWHLARAAGIGWPVLALLDGTLEALPRNEETDFSVLYASLALEHEAIFVYEAALKRNNYNRQETAAELNINRTTLYKKMRKYRLDIGEAN